MQFSAVMLVALGETFQPESNPANHCMVEAFHMLLVGQELLLQRWRRFGPLSARVSGNVECERSTCSCPPRRASRASRLALANLDTPDCQHRHTQKTINISRKTCRQQQKVTVVGVRLVKKEPLLLLRNYCS